MKTRASAPALASLLALAACSSEGAQTATPAEVSVDLFIDSAGVRITRVYPAAEFPLAKFHNHQNSLRYELLDDAGRRIVAGQVPDWRMAYTEAMADGTMRYDAQRLGWGAGSIRLPVQAGTLVVRDQGAGTELGRAAFNPAAAQSGAIGSLHQGLASDDDILGAPVQFAADGEQDAAVDLLFLGDGFTEDQLPQFEETSQNLFNAFIAAHYYSFFNARFNGWTQRVRSREQGVDDSDNGVAKDSAFDLGMGRGDLRRCVFFQTGEGQDLARRLGQEAHADVVVVIANTAEYGGCASNGIFTVTLDPGAPEIISHELGHALFNLADEYDYGGSPPCAHDTNQANVTNHGTRDGVPWADLVTASEFPTPAGSAGVGAFEGAAYCPQGMYRPEDNCLMRSLGTPFCAVCAREVNRFFDGLAPPAEPQDACPAEWYDDGICDLCLESDPDCTDVCDYNDTCDTDWGEDCSNCPADCGSCDSDPASCGDGTCSGAETDGSCAADCGCAALAQCDGVAPYGCWCDPSCAEYGDCCADLDVCGF
jgi:hypothetical protein